MSDNLTWWSARFHFKISEVCLISAATHTHTLCFAEHSLASVWDQRHLVIFAQHAHAREHIHRHFLAFSKMLWCPCVNEVIHSVIHNDNVIWLICLSLLSVSSQLSCWSGSLHYSNTSGQTPSNQMTEIEINNRNKIEINIFYIVQQLAK